MHIFNLTSFSQKCLCYLRALKCESVVFDRNCVCFPMPSSKRCIVAFYFRFFSALCISSVPFSSSLLYRILNFGVFYFRWCTNFFFIYYSICPLSLHSLRLCSRIHSPMAIGNKYAAHSQLLWENFCQPIRFVLYWKIPTLKRNGIKKKIAKKKWWKSIIAVKHCSRRATIAQNGRFRFVEWDWQC